MVSLCYRSLAGYINEDNLQGLQSFLENKQVQIDDKDEVYHYNFSTFLLIFQLKSFLYIFKRMERQHSCWQPLKAG